jgi:Bacterial Ig-like domain (group 3)
MVHMPASAGESDRGHARMRGGYVLSATGGIGGVPLRASARILSAAFLTLAVALAATACSASASNSAGSNAPGRVDRAPVTGTVTVKAGNKVICVMTVKAGKGTCKVSTADYKPGTVRFDASYSGSAGYKPSHSSAKLTLKSRP